MTEKRETLVAQRGKRVPMFVKIVPDFDEAQIKVLAVVLLQYGMDDVIAIAPCRVRRYATQFKNDGDLMPSISKERLTNECLGPIRAYDWAGAEKNRAAFAG